MLLLLAIFGGTALLMAAVGLYGLAAHLVAHRTQEIGIRVALGASRGEVVWLVIRQALVPAFAGLAAGSALSLGLTRFLTTLLYEVRPTDPGVFAAIAALLVAVTAAACAGPARRAARVDPVIALRYD
jgi:ABC-type antimicrobial peptide transport system permease subunit